MSTNDAYLLVGGLAIGAALLPLGTRLVRALLVEVAENHVALVTRHGQLTQTRTKPGAWFLPGRLLPWVEVHTISLARDFRLFSNLHVNDARGTTLLLDLWVEVRVVDARKALFGVDDWNAATQEVVTHVATSMLGEREFHQLLHDRSELGQQVQREVNEETGRWGVAIERVFVRNIALMPEVERQVVGAVAAGLERAKAEVEERGRIEVARLEASTARDVASLTAEAKSQYALGVGRALQALNARPNVLAAYTQLYEWSLLQGHRTVAFRGFAANAVRPIDAAMIPQLQLRATVESQPPPPAMIEVSSALK